MVHHQFDSCQGAVLRAAASNTGIHLRCSVVNFCSRSMIGEAMERENQISLKVGAIGFLAGEALGNVQRLLEKGAGLLALSEVTQEIAHVVVADGEVAQEVGAIRISVLSSQTQVHARLRKG
jgi:hypothetical protein